MEKPAIGAFVLETLTTGMYAQPLDCIRELVQNASDSIYAAEKKHLVGPGKGRIELIIDVQNRGLTVRDNGTGIPAAEVATRLLDVGTSSKDPATDAGFRGIGRLSAIAYCDYLEFRTRAHGENIVTTVSYDCRGIRSAVQPGGAGKDQLADVLQRYTSVQQESSSTPGCFFDVALSRVSDAAEQFLDWRSLDQYLGQVAPVRFDAQSFLYAPKINEWAEEHQVPIPCVSLVIRTAAMEREVFKPYRTFYRTKSTRDAPYDIHVTDVVFYPEKPPSDCPFWIWYAKTHLLGTIADDSVSGLRLRARNIAVGGPDRVAEIFGTAAKSDARFNGWLIGEIHVLSPRVIPNARRDGFEDVGDWPAIRRDLAEFARARISEIRASSNVRNLPVAKLQRKTEQTVGEAEERMAHGFASPEQRAKTRASVAKVLAIVADKETASQEGEVSTLRNCRTALTQALAALDNQPVYTRDRLNTQLSRSERKLISDILSILEHVLKHDDYELAERAIIEKYGTSSSRTGQ